MKKIAIFASGSGSNAQRIIEHFHNNDALSIEVSLVLTNNKKAYVIERAESLGVDCKVFDRETFYNSSQILEDLKEAKIDFIVLAGFLWLFPSSIIEHFERKILNIHPALLPKFGGKGMYGMNVHKAVVEARETQTGITIHYVNNQYDEGQIVFQATCEIESMDSPEGVANKVHELEYQYFPNIIEECVLGKR